jgi:predicted nucleic acid-binding protein
MPFLIDSNILIDVSRGNAGAIQYVDRLAEPWALSQVTAMELIVGARDKRDLATIDGFLSLCPVIPLSDSIGTEAYRLLKTYAKSHGLHIFDSLIAATGGCTKKCVNVLRNTERRTYGRNQAGTH